MSNFIKSLTTTLLIFISFPAQSFFGIFEPNVDPVKNLLKDPYTAKFHDVKDFGEGVICGSVNAKNSMGAYTGKEPFAIHNKIAYLAKDNPQEYQFFCVSYAQCISNMEKSSSNECMLYLIQKKEDEEAQKKEIEQANRQDPRNRKLRSYGHKACNDWYKFNNYKKTDDFSKVSECKIDVNKCVDKFGSYGYKKVDNCLQKISMISDTSGYFIYYLSLEKDLNLEQ